MIINSFRLRALLLVIGLLSLATTVNAKPVVTIGGAVEVELGLGDDETGASYSDITLATVELAISAQIKRRLSADLVVLHEDDDSENFVIDEAVITITLNKFLMLTAGRMYLPFGRYETGMLSDSLPLELGETQEAAIQLGYESVNAYGIIYVFNGEADEVASDEIDDFGFSLGYKMQGDSNTLDLGVDYLNNIADSDSLQPGVGVTITEQDAGIAIHALYTNGPMTYIAEQVRATDALDDGTEPAAMNIEIGYQFELASLAIAYQTTEEMAAVLPETKILLSYSKYMTRGVTLAMELANAEDYSVADGGSGESGAMLTAQMAVEF